MKSSPPPPAGARGSTLLKRLIWLYLFLWVFEGALRKWIVPQFSTPLLVIRDPVVLLIYGAAFVQGKAGPAWIWVTTVLLGIVMCVTTIAGGNYDPLVALFGLRSNLLHIPLIFVIGEAFDGQDLKRVARYTLWLTGPLVAISIWQFYAPVSAFINVGAGAVEGSQLEGALGHVRPPSVFSFNGGFVAFLNVALLFSLHELTDDGEQHRVAKWLRFSLITVGFAISISRAAVLSGIVTFCVFLLTSFRTRNLSRMGVLFAVVPVLVVGLYFVPVVRDGLRAFTERWMVASSDMNVSAYDAIVLRVWHTCTDFIGLLGTTPTLGAGLGVGTNAGAFLQTGSQDFLLAENELERLVLELGPYLGVVYILFRVAITAVIGVTVLRTYLRGSAHACVLFSVCALSIVIGQWGVATIQGATTVIAGLSLAAAYSELRRPIAPGPRAVPSASGAKRPAPRGGQNRLPAV